MTKGILKVIGLTGTVYILEYLHTHTQTQYKELNRELVPHTLNARLRELLMYKLIEHYLERKDTRKEWFFKPFILSFFQTGQRHYNE